METLFQDIRYAARMLVKNRSFTTIAVLTLALGIGANSAIFSVVNALLLKPLPFENLDQLVAVRASLPNQGLKATGVSPADFSDWRRLNSVFKEVVAYRIRDTTITSTGEPELVRGSFVSTDFFSALDIKGITGRTLLPDEDQPGRDQVVVLGRFAEVLMLVFGGIALLMSAAGVYGVMSYSVAQRTHEIGVRIALGAAPKSILRLITGQGLKTASIGLAVGLPATLGLSRFMEV